MNYKNRIVSFLIVMGVLLGGGVSGGTATASAARLIDPPRSALSTAKPAESHLTFAVSSTSVRKQEQIWVAGLVVVGAKSVAGRTVIVERRKSKSGQWKRFTSTKTRSDGWYTATFRPTAVYDYRARAAGTAAASAAGSGSRRVMFDTGARNIAARTKIAANRTGVVSSGVKTLTTKQRRATNLAGVQTVQHQEFSKATVVKVRAGDSTRTWLVLGRINAAYRAAGGSTGTYGVPLRDAKCGLREGGCVQRFSKGTLYWNANKSKAYGTGAGGGAGEAIATARSQVGYRYKFSNNLVQNTKYNKFMNDQRPWCSYYLSWVSAASGQGTALPQKTSFTSF